MGYLGKAGAQGSEGKSRKGKQRSVPGSLEQHAESRDVPEGPGHRRGRTPGYTEPMLPATLFLQNPSILQG